MFSSAYIIEELSRNLEVFRKLLTGRTPETYNWRPSPVKWSLLEIVCHLHDEEVEDFRTRVRVTIESPGIHPPPIDPVGWVQQRNYSSQDYEAVLSKFLAERQYSIEWLKSLERPNWDNSFHHSKLGDLTASMFLANWLAHDYLHIRQINRYCFEILKQDSSQDLSYAGDW